MKKKMKKHSRNCGIGTRDMVSAARSLFSDAQYLGDMSFSTAATLPIRLKQFVKFARKKGVGRFELVTRDLLIRYGEELADQVVIGEMESSYAQNLVSSVNTLMRYAAGSQWLPVSPTKECGIPERCHVRQSPPGGMVPLVMDALVAELIEMGLLRAASLCELARYWGVRCKEAAILGLSRALKDLQASILAEGVPLLYVRDGTKGGMGRTVPLLQRKQLAVIEVALQHAGSDRCLVPTGVTWAKWRGDELRRARPILKKFGIDCFHDLRAAYACSRYHDLAGSLAPVLGGEPVNADIHRKACEIIALELGHKRIAVVASYIGSWGK